MTMPSTFSLHSAPGLLSLAGTLPFVAGALLLWTDSDMGAARIHAAIATYAAVVLSFLGGIQWGTAVSVGDAAPKSAQSLFLLSVIPSLLAWAMLFIDATGSRLMTAIVLFGFVWMIDALLYLQKLIPGWFFRIRSTATPIVVLSLIAALLRA